MFLVSVMFHCCSVDQFNLYEGNLCSEFTEVIQHNEGKFFGTDRKLLYTVFIINMCSVCVCVCT